MQAIIRLKNSLFILLKWIAFIAIIQLCSGCQRVFTPQNIQKASVININLEYYYEIEPETVHQFDSIVKHYFMLRNQNRVTPRITFNDKSVPQNISVHIKKMRVKSIPFQSAQYIGSLPFAAGFMIGMLEGQPTFTTKSNILTLLASVVSAATFPRARSKFETRLSSTLSSHTYPIITRNSQYLLFTDKKTQVREHAANCISDLEKLLIHWK
jgi:hypothetical protein